ncbi:MAG TPA: exosortase-associated EpsI family protein [Candidatus Paceibacterota bacterium]|nr:exosortase-associated EpsI family protein [Candidatus Paceibacterota bacterium]
MNTQKRILLVVVLLLIGGTGFAVTWFRAHQKLGTPGIKAVSIPGSMTMKFDLPETVLDYASTNLPTSEVVINFLPKDTSYAERLYKAPDGFWVHANIILMGADRTSIHKPEFCLPGQGWQIREKSEQVLTIEGPQTYQMPVARWVIRNTEKLPDGSTREVSGLYVFWFVADNEQTSRNNERMWWITRDLLRTGVLQRWAYVSYMATCLPGQEDATFERMARLISASVPEFQHPPRLAAASAVARQ